jgi:hypothetical protein
VSKLSWGTLGERYYEAGIDRGVLYLTGEDGVVWNGLISVDEKPSGGDFTPYYLDGTKAINLASAEDFSATIQAYSSPSKFDACDGIVSLHQGLFATNQPRKSFGFSYRTKIGDDVNGLDKDYKIHLVYNALAAPSDRGNATIAASTDPTKLSWDISTIAPLIDGYKATAHLIIDSTAITSLQLPFIEAILYGSIESPPRLPTPQELIAIIAETITLFITILEDGAYSAEGLAVQEVSSGIFSIDHESVVAYEDGSFTIF